MLLVVLFSGLSINQAFAITTVENGPIDATMKTPLCNGCQQDEDIVRTTLGIGVTIYQGDLIKSASINFNGGEGTTATNLVAHLYDQDLNFLATSTEVAVPTLSGDDEFRANFPFNHIIGSGTTEIFVALQADAPMAGLPELSITLNGDGEAIMMIRDISDLQYPNAPPIFEDDVELNEDSTFWTAIDIQLASDPTVPDQVTGLTATATGLSTIELVWIIPDDGGSTITGYQIERESPIGGGFTTIVTYTGTTGTTFENTGLTPETQYNYRVSAINAEGLGPASDEAAATTFTPVEAVDDLTDVIQDLIDDETLTGGQGGSLISKLDNIIEKIENGQTNASCNQLDAFINQISAFVNNGTLTEEEGQIQIDATQAIKDAAGC